MMPGTDTIAPVAVPLRPLCFVAMPFGLKRDVAGAEIDFDDVYQRALRPAIEDAGLEPIRSDEERTGGIIHRAMFERLLLCDFAVVDLTTANANVFYELGIRHAVRPCTTLTIFAAKHLPPFDVNYLRSLPYQLSDGNQLPADTAAALRQTIAARLVELRALARDSPVDSPLFQLLSDYPAPDLAHMRTDVFRERERYSAALKQQLADARTHGHVDRLRELEAGLAPFDSAETGTLVDLFLSYRAVEAHADMVRLYQLLPLPLQRTVMIREQLAFALNRLGRGDEALRVLQELIDKGGSSETYGLMGRIYKDRWVAARKVGDAYAAEGNLNRAIECYVKGFERDSRDAFPGVNAVTLLDIRGDAASKAKRDELLPVVRFAVSQRLRSTAPDYWDHATWLELAVLADDEPAARRAAADAIASVREKWEPKTTANNLSLIHDARVGRGEQAGWIADLIAALSRAAA